MRTRRVSPRDRPSPVRAGCAKRVLALLTKQTCPDSPLGILSVMKSMEASSGPDAPSIHNRRPVNISGAMKGAVP